VVNRVVKATKAKTTRWVLLFVFMPVE
jgi:hypothetical protein